MPSFGARGFLAALLVCVFARETAAQVQLTPDAAPFKVEFGANYFVQISSRQNLPYNDEAFTDEETFLWERLRPKLTVSNSRVSFVLEGQDTHAKGSEFGVRRAWFDLLNAFVEVRQMRGWSLKIGRRQADFDTIPRLIRVPDFAAVVRSFDVAEASWQHRSTDLRAFAFRTVENDPDRFNTWKAGERLWTVFAAQTLGQQKLQTYVTTKHNTSVRSESGTLGSGAIYAWQVQSYGHVARWNVTYSLEHILERGHTSNDDVRASGLFGSLMQTYAKHHDVEVRYVRTSGDERADDGKRGTFDPFYPANGPIGGLGLMRFSNLHALSIGATHTLTNRATLAWRLHESHLTTLNDAWYLGSSVTGTIVRRNATSSRIGSETDVIFIYRFSPKLTTRVGYFGLRPGAYLKNTGGYGSPYEFRVQIYGDL
ncbi:MAG: alginate export family protein [Gemmatimonadota bacterium]